MRIKLFHVSLLMALLATLTQYGCTKFVQIGPPTSSIAISTIYSSNATAAAAISSIYENLNWTDGFLPSGNGSIGYLMGLAADELINYNPTNMKQAQFYTNALSSSSNSTS